MSTKFRDVNYFKCKHTHSKFEFEHNKQYRAHTACAATTPVPTVAVCQHRLQKTTKSFVREPVLGG